MTILVENLNVENGENVENVENVVIEIWNQFLVLIEAGESVNFVLNMFLICFSWL